MKRNHGLNSTNNTTKISTNTTTTKSAKVRKSHSSPTNSPLVPLTDPTSIPYSSELPKSENEIPISPSSNKKKSLPARLNTSFTNNNNNHLSSFTTTATPTTNSHERPPLRMSASSRFGKNLLPTWLGGHSTDDAVNPTSTSSNSTNVSEELDLDELTTTFETLLDELNMKDGHREKLRQLPKERKLYLLQQNQHIKENRVVDSALRKSMPTSNSSTSLFPPKALRQKQL
ncbi:unnamed protein product [Mucor hiemalis]